MPIPHGVIEKAWADKRGEIEQLFRITPENDRPAVHAPQLQDYEDDIPDIGLCLGGDSRSTYWKAKGPTRIHVRDLFVWNLKDPKQKTPLFSTDGDAVVLPITFSLLEVRGSFEVTTPCACYGFLGNEFMSQTRTQTGHLFESFASSSLDFTLAMAGSRLTYSGVAVPGVPSMKAVIDSDLPDWLQQLGSIMSGHDIGESIRRSMVNVFATAQFTLRMIETMNKAIGLAH